MNKETDLKAELRALRKKIKRLEESRSLNKHKNSEKGKTIKAYQDREVELKQSRDRWKNECKVQEKENEILAREVNKLTNDLKDKEKELLQIRDDFNKLKKKNSH